MDAEQITKLLKCWKRRHAELMAVYNAMGKLTGADRYSTLFTPIFDLWNDYTVAMSELIGDKAGWLQWYEIECDMGRAPMMVVLRDGREIKVKTLRQLATLISQGN